MKHGVVYVPRAVVATPVRAAPSIAVAVNVTGCTARDANDRSASPMRATSPCASGQQCRAVHDAIAVLAVTSADRSSSADCRSRRRAATAAIVRPGPGQIAILDAPPGSRTSACSSAVTRRSPKATVDLAGSLLFRGLEPGDYTVEIETSTAPVTTTDVAVPGFDEPPPQEFYDDQEIDPGFGYLTVRDGTTLSVNVVLPGDVDDGPFPTVVEYSALRPERPGRHRRRARRRWSPPSATPGSA